MNEHWTKEQINLGFSATTYITNVIPKLEKLWRTEFKTIKTPMENNFHPELDNSPLLSDEDAAIYRTSTGSLN